MDRLIIQGVVLILEEIVVVTLETVVVTISTDGGKRILTPDGLTSNAEEPKAGSADIAIVESGAKDGPTNAMGILSADGGSQAARPSATK